MSARQVLTIPPIVGGLVSFLNGSLADRSESARAVWAAPNPRPNEFVKVMQLSANRLSIAHAEVFITCECWALTGARADALGALVYAIASSAELASGAYCPAGPRGTLAAPYASDDPDSKLPRSIFTVRFIVPVETI